MSADGVPRSKRVLDLVLLVLIAPVAVPLSVAVAAVVRVTIGKPVLFSQERPGLHETPFRIRKFRTMRQPTGHAELDTDEARLTRVGSMLRQLSLDELPEFWNILAGDMSFVGPRPLLAEYLPHYSPRQRTRHAVLPGLTGLAQVEGRNQVGWDERLELDAQYAESWSLWGDIRILCRTIGVVLRREGISEDGHATRSKFAGSAAGRSTGGSEHGSTEEMS